MFHLFFIFAFFFALGQKEIVQTWLIRTRKDAFVNFQVPNNILSLKRQTVPSSFWERNSLPEMCAIFISFVRKH